MTSVPRHRERVSHNVEDVMVRTSPDPNYVEQTFGPYPVSNDAEIMDDVVVDRFHERIAKGEIINNPVSYVHTVLESIGSGHGEYQKNGTPYPHFNDGAVTADRVTRFPYVGSVLSDTRPASERDAKAKAIANIDSTPYAFAEDALELGETIRFLRKPTESLQKLSAAFLKAVRSHPKASSDLGKAVAETWLTYRFAISPLVKSSHDLLEQWWSYAKKEEPPRLTARGFSVAEDEGESVLYDSSGKFGYEVSKSYSNIGKASILYTVSNPIRDFRYRLGIRSKDVPAAIWAVMPYSFMVDRVVDISSMIQGLSNLLDPNVRILSACYSSRAEEKSSVKHVSEQQTGWSITVQGETRVQTDFVYTRTPWHPGLFDTVPAFTGSDLYNSITKMADLWALIRVRLKH